MEYMQQIVESTNASPLPAFVKVDVLEQALAEMRKIADSELKRDQAQYMSALRAEQEKQGKETEEGEKHDQHDV